MLFQFEGAAADAASMAAASGVRFSSALSLARRVFESYIVGELRHTGLFRGISEASMREIAPLFKLEEVGVANAVIFDDGDEADRCYVLLLGSVQVRRGATVLASLRAHDRANPQDSYPLFGEQAMLDSKPRMASVVTAEPCKLLALPRHAFQPFLGLVPDIRRRLQRTSEMRKAHAAAHDAAHAAAAQNAALLDRAASSRALGEAAERRAGDSAQRRDGEARGLMRQRTGGVLVAASDEQQDAAATLLQARTRGNATRRALANRKTANRQVPIRGRPTDWAQE